MVPRIWATAVTSGSTRIAGAYATSIIAHATTTKVGTALAQVFTKHPSTL